MAKHASQGKCLLCNSTYGKAAMTKHVKSCIPKNINVEKSTGNEKINNKKNFHIIVEGRRLPKYWLHIKASGKAKLTDLDNFLRNIWLECCGHLSAFDIQGVRYSSSPMQEYNESGMNKKLENLLEPKMKFFYEYDYGSTTGLALKVVSEGNASIKEKPINLVARNEAPLIICEKCSNNATSICCECIYNGEGFLCDDCVSTHECGEEMMLPVVNSPRMGVCSYTG